MMTMTRLAELREPTSIELHILRHISEKGPLSHVDLHHLMRKVTDYQTSGRQMVGDKEVLKKLDADTDEIIRTTSAAVEETKRKARLKIILAEYERLAPKKQGDESREDGIVSIAQRKREKGLTATVRDATTKLQELQGAGEQSRQIAMAYVLAHHMMEHHAQRLLEVGALERTEGTTPMLQIPKRMQRPVKTFLAKPEFRFILK